MASPAFDTDAFDTQAFDTEAFDLGEGVGPTPDAGGNFGRRRIATYVKRGGVGTLRGRTT